VAELSVTQERAGLGIHPGFWATVLTGRDNKSADIGRILFAAAIVAAIALEIFVVVWRGTAFDLVQFCGGVSSLLLAGGASLAVKAQTEPSETKTEASVIKTEVKS
jgi:hypothetical protein